MRSGWPPSGTRSRRAVDRRYRSRREKALIPRLRNATVRSTAQPRNHGDGSRVDRNGRSVGPWELIGMPWGIAFEEAAFHNASDGATSETTVPMVVSSGF